MRIVDFFEAVFLLGGLAGVSGLEAQAVEASRGNRITLAGNITTEDLSPQMVSAG